jgi:hypothetical protein
MVEQTKKAQEQKRQACLSGSGRYLYENNTDSDLNLPKPTRDGIRNIGPRKRFEGDSYYMKLVGQPMNLLRLIEKISQTEDVNKEKEMTEKKLILDQPDIVGNQGKVEHVVVDQTPTQPLNDNTDPNAKPDVLLNESPVDGVEIILG